MRKYIGIALLAALSGCAAVGGGIDGFGSEGPATLPRAGGVPVLEGALADRFHDDWSRRHLPRDVGQRSWGIRGGYVMPMNEKRAEWAPMILYGAFVRTFPRGSEYEVGVDVSLAESVEIDSTLVTLRVDRILSRGGGSGLYLVGGGHAFMEQAESKTFDLTRRMWTFNVNAGAGVRTLGLRLDLRGTYSLILGSDNVQGVAVGSLALLF